MVRLDSWVKSPLMHLQHVLLDFGNHLKSSVYKHEAGVMRLVFHNISTDIDLLSQYQYSFVNHQLSCLSGFSHGLLLNLCIQDYEIKCFVL